jgi:hypothetical protein
MKSNPVFALTGKRATLEVLQILEGMFCAIEDHWVSGDYKAATDGIHPWFGTFTQDLIASHLELTYEERNWYLKSMVGHLLDYSVSSSIQEEPILQTWGQLMGSPSSFPILCIINCAAFSAAVVAFERLVDNLRYQSYRFEHYKKFCSDNSKRNGYLDEAIYERKVGSRLGYLQFAYGLFINGDDILFHGPPELISLWRLYSRQVGLTPSMGKNFESGALDKHPWAMINTTLFRFKINHRLEEIDLVEHLPFIKMGLAQGKSKVMGDTRDDRPNVDDQLFSTIDKLTETGFGLETCSEKMQKTRDVFFHHNLSQLLKSKRPWSLPRCLGGIGIPDFGLPNPTQKRVAEYLRTHPESSSQVEMLCPQYPTATILPKCNFFLSTEEKRDTWMNFGAGYWLTDELERREDNYVRLMNRVSPKEGKYPPEIDFWNLRDWRKSRTVTFNV